jgi:DNA-binding response OmpR family regulator
MTERFDVIVLDVMLPGINGYGLARTLRSSVNASSRHTPVLMLTACDREDQIIQGLELGADYYMTKPFSFLELLARIKSVRRHTAVLRDPCIRVADLVFDPEHQLVKRDGRAIELTRTERTLLACLLRSLGETVPRSTLMAEVWGDQNKVGNSTLDAFMNLLRNKVDSPYKRKLIETKRGAGYLIRSTATSDSASRRVER